MTLLVAALVFYCIALQSTPGATTVCGRQQLRTRIFGGTNAAPGEWPWHVGLSFKGKPNCGGSLISESWLLTVAHCFENTAGNNKRDPALWRVHLGFTRMGFTPEESSTITVTPSRIVVHSAFKNYIQGHDIALVELPQPVSFSRFISPICLPERTHQFHLRSTCYTTGLQDVPEGVSLDSKRLLQKVSQTLIGWRTCNCIYNTQMRPELSNPAKPGMLCILDTFGEKGPCLGDSGGPVVCNEDGVWFLAGAISFSQGCHLQDNPTIVTSASFYQDWIQQLTGSSVTFSPQSIVVTDDVDNDSCSDLLSNLTSGCGYSDIDTEGSVSPGPWPWQVDLWKDDRRVCGGALISPNWVITAAQCFVGPDSSDSPSDWSVTVASGTQAMSQLAVQKIRIHGSYITPHQGNNVALIQLSIPAPLGPYSEPICLPQSSHNIPYNASCWFSGKDSHQQDTRIQPAPGLKMDLVGPNQCNCIYSRPNSDKPSVSILPGMICATRAENIGAPCLGDLGGPLACKEDKTWFLIGLRSFGGSCDTLLPQVFTDITQYENWIFRETREAAFRSQLNTWPPEKDTDRCSFESPRTCGHSIAPPGTTDDVTEKTWPWQVSLQLYESHVCSGVLIAETWFLIAAHCISRFTSLSDYTVSLSRQLQDGPNPREVTRKIKRVVSYPGYKVKTGENDLALVEMFFGITFSDYILPICLTDGQSLLPPTRCWVTGWGRLYPSDRISSPPPLRHLEVSLLDVKDCGASGNIAENGGRLCAAARRDNGLTCLMDSSAPLVCQPQPGAAWILYGLSSQSSPPTKSSCPRNFTAVMSKLSWIREVVPNKDLHYLDSNRTTPDAGHNDSVPSANTTTVPPPMQSSTVIPDTTTNNTTNTNNNNTSTNNNTNTSTNTTIKTDGSCPEHHTEDGVACAGHITTTPNIIKSTIEDRNQQTNLTANSTRMGSGAGSLRWNRATHCLLLLLSLGIWC